MDFGSPFALLCLLVIITVSEGSATRTGVLSGGSAVFSLGIQSLQDFSSMSKNNGRCIITVLNDTLLAKCGSSASRCLNLENGSLVLRSVEQEDKGEYEFVFQNTTRSFTLEVFEPTIGIRCFPDGTAELFCNVTSSENMSFQWLLNGTNPSVPGACVKDGGKKVHLDKTVPGEFVCLVAHGTGALKTRPIELSCSYGDLLQYPWFIYILAGCAAGVLILVVALPAAICCCMKRKHKFIPVPSEEEKDDGLTMSVVSSEGMKSPPNGDRVEAQAAQADRPPKPDAAQTGQGVEPQPPVEENLPVQIEAEEMPDPEVVVDMESHEDASDCFPDPADE